MHVFECSHFNVNLFVFKEALEAWEKVLFSVLWSKDLGKLVDTAGKGLFYSCIVDLSELVVQRLEPGPFFITEHIDESWEVETCMIAHVFILTSLRSINIEIDNLRVDITSSFEGTDEWSYVLESCTTHQLRSWVL